EGFGRTDDVTSLVADEAGSDGDAVAGGALGFWCTGGATVTGSGVAMVLVGCASVLVLLALQDGRFTAKPTTANASARPERGTRIGRVMVVLPRLVALVRSRWLSDYLQRVSVANCWSKNDCMKSKPQLPAPPWSAHVLHTKS